MEGGTLVPLSRGRCWSRFSRLIGVFGTDRTLPLLGFRWLRRRFRRGFVGGSGSSNRRRRDAVGPVAVGRGKRRVQRRAKSQVCGENDKADSFQPICLGRCYTRVVPAGDRVKRRDLCESLPGTVAERLAP